MTFESRGLRTNRKRLENTFNELDYMMKTTDDKTLQNFWNDFARNRLGNVIMDIMEMEKITNKIPKRRS